MASGLLPIFIGTPFIGQGDILNDEWIDGRIALFEAVTKNSLIRLLGDRVHWLVFLGKNPTTKVRDYASNRLGKINNIHLIEDRFESQNIVNLAIEKSEMDNFVTMVIADDDAWPGNYISTVREKATILLESGDEHAGMTFANGLEWLMSDQVDIDFLNKSGFHILRKMNLVEYHYPWLGPGFFVLQTKSRPFRNISSAHPTIPKWLAEEGFSVHVSEDPSRSWLYNRHQLADSSLVKSDKPSLKFSLKELEDEFGIDSEKVAAWPSSRFGSYYCQKRAHGAGLLEMFDFSDVSDFIHIPRKALYLEKGKFSIDPFSEFNISGDCRIRIYDETLGTYTLFLILDSISSRKIHFHKSIFAANHSYKFDIQKIVEGKWKRIMPFILLKLEETLSETYDHENIESILPVFGELDNSEKYRISIQENDANNPFFIFETPGENIHSCIFDQSVLSEKKKYSFSVSKFVDGWEVVQSGPINSNKVP